MTRRRTGDFDEIITSLERDTQTPEWKRSIESQTRTIQWLQEFEQTMPEHLWKRGLDAIGQGLSITPERTSAIFQLNELKEVRRALRFKPTREHHRMSGESVYPRDGWLGAYLLYAQGSEVPLAWHFWCAVSLFGAACRRNIYIDRHNHELWTNHYIMLIGRTASKKSQAIDTATDILHRLNERLERLDIPIDKRIRLMPKRCTPERFIHLIKREKKIEIIEGRRVKERWTEAVAMFAVGELVTLFGRSAFHSDQHIHLLTDLWGCPRDFPASTIGRGDEWLHNVAITFLGGSTPDWIRTSVTEDLFGGGFMGRCVFVPRDDSGRVFPLPSVLDPVTANWLADQLVKWATADQIEFTLTHGAEDWHDDWYHENKRIVVPDPKMQGYYERKSGHLLKLAMVMALAQDRTHATPDDLMYALRILDNEEKYLPECFGEMSSTHEARMCDLVMNMVWAHGGAIAQSKLHRKVRKQIGSARDLSRIVETLQAQKRLIRDRDEISRSTYYRAVRWDPNTEE